VRRRSADSRHYVGAAVKRRVENNRLAQRSQQPPCLPVFIVEISEDYL